MGARSKYTPETVGRITDAIKLGATYELASAYGGITTTTFNVWRNTKPAFSEAVKEAEGLAAVQWLAKIEKAAADGAWQAAAWKLERRYPHAYGRVVQEHVGKGGGPIQHDHTHRDISAFTDDEMDALAEIAERRKADKAP